MQEIQIIHYNVPNDLKTFLCKDCNKNANCISWKINMDHIGGTKFKCDNCWKNYTY